jgi:hypothetical protein
VQPYNAVLDGTTKGPLGSVKKKIKKKKKKKKKKKEEALA